MPASHSSGNLAGSNSDLCAEMVERDRERMQHEMTKSVNALVDAGEVVVGPVLSVRDRVLVFWSEEHNHYAVYTSAGSAFHFVHSSSIEELGLDKAGSGMRRPLVAFVLSKEYCETKKAENRFRIPKGTKFYRVVCCKPENGERRLKEMKYGDYTFHYDPSFNVLYYFREERDAKNKSSAT